jgi:hypothetical protein
MGATPRGRVGDACDQEEGKQCRREEDVGMRYRGLRSSGGAEPGAKERSENWSHG